MIRDPPERFCNITSWCVLQPYRSHSLRLAMALVSQPGYHFTDLSPTQLVAGTLRFLKKGFFATTLPECSEMTFSFVHLECDIY